MLINLSVVKKYLTPLIPSVVVIGIFFTLFHDDFNRDSKAQMKELKRLNDSLLTANTKILSEISQSQADSEKQDEIIRVLWEESFLLKEQIGGLKNELRNVKSQYEKANTHSDNFTSNDIQRYFSNL